MTTIALFGSSTHTGRVRKHNEDCIGVFPGQGLYVVADGMGGAAGGAVASRIAVETVSATIGKGYSLPAAITEAHEAIARAVVSGDGCPGMATTVVAMQITGEHYHLAWVGDSRVYYLNDGIKQLTHDHSLVQELVDRGTITEEERRFHPRRNVIRRALGSSAVTGVDVDECRGVIKAGDTFVLCSDGLHGLVEDEDIRQAVTGADHAQDAADTLVQIALDAGGTDNISVIVVEAG
jgi:protein phosphatase